MQLGVLILEKTMSNFKSLISFYYNKFTQKENKTHVQIPRPQKKDADFKNNIKPLSNSVLTMVSKLKEEKNKTENIKNMAENGTNFLDGRGISLEEKIKIFIEENRQGENIPSANEIENYFDISEKRKRPIMKSLVQKGFLIQNEINKKYYFNLDYKGD
jgi:hypothetical protein